MNANEVGEIWISSPSVALGYYNQSDVTKSQFHATLNNNDDNEQKKFLRTGDLGFIYNNELFICGRKKDLIIINGRNYYPQDVECTAEDALSIDVIRPGCTAAFDIELDNDSSTTTNNNNIKIVLLMKLRDAHQDDEYCQTLCTKLYSSMQKEHGLPLTHINLL